MNIGSTLCPCLRLLYNYFSVFIQNQLKFTLQNEDIFILLLLLPLLHYKFLMIRFSKVFIYSYVSLQSLFTYGQDPSFKDRLCFEADANYGFVMPHLKSIAYFVDEHIKGYQFNVGILTNGEKKWHNYYNYPRLGIGFYHSNLGNSQIYGHVSALYGYFDRYFFKLNSRFNLGNRLAFGIGYINKKFDLQDNYFDLAIGSHVNVYINYGLEGLVRISPLVQMKLGLGMTHVSNGRFKEPNQGLNMITSFVGVQYSLNDPYKYITNESKETDEPGRNQLILMGSAGEKQISRKYTYTYWPTSLSAEYARKISRTSWVGLAISTYLDPSLKKEIEMEGDTAKNGDNIRIALNFSYELKMGRFSYIFQPGFYLKNSYTKPGTISNKIGLRYQLNRRWLTGITIKAHWLAIADFIEWGIGYRLNY